MTISSHARHWAVPLALSFSLLGVTPARATTHGFQGSETTAVSTLRINLRAAPDLNSRITAQLRKGDPVTVVGASGEFVRVHTTAGTPGYVKAKYLVFAQPATVSAPAVVSAPVVVDEPAPTPAPTHTPTPAVTEPASAEAAPPPEPVVEPTAIAAQWYARAGLGWHYSRQDPLDFGERLRAEGFPIFIDNVDDEAAQLSLTVGYRLLPFLSVEAGLLHLGDVGFTLTLDDPARTDVPALLERLQDIVPATGTGITVSGVGHWDYARWRLSARAGIYRALDRDVKLRVGGESHTFKPRAHSALLGVGIDYALTPRWRLGFDVQTLNLHDDITAWGATLTFVP